jgi:hypothetical protein
MLSVEIKSILLNIVILSVKIKSIVLNVVMLSVVMFSVVAPFFTPSSVL